MHSLLQSAAQGIIYSFKVNENEYVVKDKDAILPANVIKMI